MARLRHSDGLRPALLIALALSIPAFYLVLTGSTDGYRKFGSLLYGVAAILLAVEVRVHIAKSESEHRWRKSSLDLAIVVGAAVSAWPTDPDWSFAEWLFRLGLCALVFVRLSMHFVNWVAPHKLLQLLTIAIVSLAFAGAGFYWLEPGVHTYADGLWLAFTTGATVGYGDIVPSTAASRIFAVFIVLLGYAVFSIVTASIAALFVGEDEKRFERELHADVRALRDEIAALRDELRATTAERDAARNEFSADQAASAASID